MNPKINDILDDAKKGRYESSRYLRSVLAISDNYTQRFIICLAFIQLLYLFNYTVIDLFLFLGFGLENVTVYITLICLMAGVVLITLFLFVGVKVSQHKFYTIGIIYFILAVLLIGAFRGTTGFMRGVSLTNLIYSVEILIIGAARTFILGFVHNYKK